MTWSADDSTGSGRSDRPGVRRGKPRGGPRRRPARGQRGPGGQGRTAGGGPAADRLAVGPPGVQPGQGERRRRPSHAGGPRARSRARRARRRAHRGVRAGRRRAVRHRLREPSRAQPTAGALLDQRLRLGGSLRGHQGLRGRGAGEDRTVQPRTGRPVRLPAGTGLRQRADRRHGSRSPGGLRHHRGTSRAPADRPRSAARGAAVLRCARRRLLRPHDVAVDGGQGGPVRQQAGGRWWRAAQDRGREPAELPAVHQGRPVRLLHRDDAPPVTCRPACAGDRAHPGGTALRECPLLRVGRGRAGVGGRDLERVPDEDLRGVGPDPARGAGHRLRAGPHQRGRARPPGGPGQRRCAHTRRTRHRTGGAGRARGCLPGHPGPHPAGRPGCRRELRPARRSGRRRGNGVDPGTPARRHHRRRVRLLLRDAVRHPDPGGTRCAGHQDRGPWRRPHAVLLRCPGDRGGTSHGGQGEPGGGPADTGGTAAGPRGGRQGRRLRQRVPLGDRRAPGAGLRHPARPQARPGVRPRRRVRRERRVRPPAALRPVRRGDRRLAVPQRRLLARSRP